MLDASKYSVAETLHDGRAIQIRALKPEDREDILAAAKRTSAQSLFLRFFAAKRSFTEQEIAFFLNVDFTNHVALVAVANENGRPVIAGGGRYVVARPGSAEVAFVVIDLYQGQGIGTILLRHLVLIGREAGLQELIAEVLPGNTVMMNVFRNSRLRVVTKREPEVVHVTLAIA